MSVLRLYLRYVATSIRSQLQQPKASIMMTFTLFFNTAISFGAVWGLFARFGSLRGWTIREVSLLYGVASVTFAFAEMFGRGFDRFGNLLVRTGDFDRLLLRPRATAFQVLAHEVRVAAFGRLLQGAFVFSYGLGGLDAALGPRSILLLVAAFSAGFALFVGIFILQATLTFWTVDSLEVFNVLTDGGMEAMRYPLTVYERWLRGFLTYVIPFACVTYYPLLGVLGRPDPLGGPTWLAYAGPLLGFAFLGISLLVWTRGVLRYTSVGS